MNRLTNVTQGTLTSSLFYDDLGRRTKLVLPNGINALYSYDTASRLTSITYQGAATNKIYYTYDATGNRVAQASLLAVYNLPAAISNSAYYDANHQLLFGSYNMLYDANGNVTNIVNGASVNNLVWSARNQLTNMTGAVTATFRYDGLGRRVQRTGVVLENYIYDGLNVALSRAGVTKYANFRGLGIDEPWQRTHSVGTTTNSSTYLADALGSIVALTDTGKVIQTEYDYEPFGATITTGASNNNRYKFTGREDDGTGLYYYRARYYHPVLGRFVSEDPIDMADGPNGYAYVGSSPIDLWDPFGLTACDDFADSLVKDWENQNWGSPSAGLGKRLFGQRQTTLKDFSGFRDELVAGGQGGAVSRHIYGHAGLFLQYGVFGTGGSCIVGLGDRVQPLYDRDRTQAETDAELAGNAAGLAVGEALHRSYGKSQNCNDDPCKAGAKERLGEKLRKIHCK